MASASVRTDGSVRAGALLLACAAEHGSAAHPWPASPALLRSPNAARDFADLIHFLCILHGRYPGVIDHASLRCVAPEARAWLAQASYAFAGERAYVARLAVAAGPVPSTPGAGDSDSVVLHQRHAIEMLSQSERNGCALGAAMALVLDWTAVRRALDAAAVRFGIEVPEYRAADVGEIANVADQFASGAAAQRALLFGAQQILMQHFGLWDLLEARHHARGA
jgi:hypothetical protein